MKNNVSKHQQECFEAYEKFVHEYDIKQNVEHAIWDFTFQRPEKPPIKTIANFGLEKSKRKFPYYSKEFIRDMEQKEGTDEYVKFVAEEWRRRYEGYWFFNGDNLEYITGHHYCMLQYFLITVEMNGRNVRTNPRFRDSHRDLFYALETTRNDKNSFGIVYYSFRRTGKTIVALAEGYFDTTENKESVFAIQSKTEDDGRKVFKKLVDSWQKIPSWFKPVDTGETTVTKRLFFGEKKKKQDGEKEYREVLNSEIFYINAKEEALDGTYCSFIFDDEVGKCLAKGTDVRMANGELKKIEDIKNGDLILNPNGTSNVISTVSGYDRMYKVTSNTTESFICNSKHVLTLKWSRRKVDFKYNGNRYKYGNVIDISVEDYLKLGVSDKKHLMLYKEKAEFKHKKTLLDPYFLGAWLGDGYSHNPSICGVDLEVFSKISKVYDNYSVSTNKKVNKKLKVYYFRKISHKLTKLNLYKNKHIPNEYMFNSEYVRLEVLAGLIDTDGHLNIKNGYPTNYEITQKNKRLAYQIYDLVNSLGFKARIKKEVASMKRKDGTYYYCDVYRVNIFGDLNRIPCQIKRKQAAKNSTHKNRRNPMRSGFNVEYVGVDEYYGFTLDNSPYFFLSDYSVAHNCAKGLDVNERWNINRECLVSGNKIVGTSIQTSTIEDMEKYGSDKALVLWNRSDPNKRLPNNRTDSGLYRFFLPAYYGYDGEHPETEEPFIDEFGYSNIKLAKSYIESMYKSLTGDDLLSFRRKYPITIDDCFALTGSDNTFDQKKIYEQEQFNKTTDGKLVTRGTFYWKDGIKDTEVLFKPSENGKWLVAWMPPAEDRCRFEIKNGQRRPTRDFCKTGCDPFSHRETVDKGSRGASATILQKHYSEPDLKMAFVCLYLARPKHPHEFAEDMIMQSVFYSSPFLSESNKFGVLDYFHKRGYDGFCLYNPLDPNYMKEWVKGKRGVPTTGSDIREALISMTQAYIMDYIGKNEETEEHGFCPFDEILEDWRKFEPDNWTPYDAFVATALAIMATKKPLNKVTITYAKTTDWLPKFSQRGKMSVRI